MRRILSRYRGIPGNVRRFILAEFLLTLVNSVLMLVFNLYLRNLGHDDAFIARMTSYRFLGVLALAVPVGMLIRGRRLRPLLLLASVLIPAASWVMLGAASRGQDGLLALAMTVWGLGMMSLQVSNLPLIVRETPERSVTEAISLSFSMFPLSLLACGVLVPAFRALGGLEWAAGLWSFDEAGVIRAFVLLSLGALPLMAGLGERPPPREARPALGQPLGAYDWGLVLRVSLPHVVIAVGAGLTIPFVNLFFNGVFGLDARQFSMLGGGAGALVILGALLNPAVRRRYGYQVAITLSQSLAVGLLVVLALTELLQDLPGVFWLAVVCFLLRQPLMNMAGPISSELAMSYVGERNRDLIAALQASIWSGSWFLSARLFQLLRGQDFHYWQIFLITAALYGMGVALYAWLIRDHERRQRRAA